MPPGWVCEILSPATAQTDRSVKMPIYAAQGVAYLWLIDPGLKTLEAYACNDGKWLLPATLKEDDPVRLPRLTPSSFRWRNCGRSQCSPNNSLSPSEGVAKVPSPGRERVRVRGSNEAQLILK